MTVEGALTIAVALLGTVMFPIVGVLIVAWSDLQSIKRERAELVKIAAHEVRIAILEAVVKNLEHVPDSLNRIEALLRGKANP